MFAFSLGPLTAEELAALEAKEKETKGGSPKRKAKTTAGKAKRPRATAARSKS